MGLKLHKFYVTVLLLDRLVCQPIKLHVFLICCDEHVLACLIPLSVSVPAEVTPAMLDEQKSNGNSMSNIAYQEMYANYKNWIKEYINPYCDGPFEEDLGC
jgi:hypothetical protein